MALAARPVTGVTPVTNGSCHTSHAPLGRDMGRDAWGPPYYVGGPWRHACHAGLKFENGLIQAEQQGRPSAAHVTLRRPQNGIGS